VSALRRLSREQQRAGIAAAALFVTLFLPWYRATFVIGGAVRHDNLSAFEVFSFVEAAVLVVAAAVLYLLWARSQERAFHLPGGDGWAVTIAGFWVVFLLVWRLFDKPDVRSGPIGVQWGLFVAMAVGGGLAAAGQRMRAERRPEPPNPAAEDDTWETPVGRRRRRERPERRPVDSRAVTRVLRDQRPSWEGEPPEPPSRAPRPRPTEGLPDAPTRRLPRRDDDPPGDGDDDQPRLF
jgi:hypothetical protein